MIVHLSTAHPRDDSRVRYKIARSIARCAEEETVLVVQDGQPEERDGRLRILSAGGKLPRQRNRLSSGIWRALSTVHKLKPGLVHFHDPELIPVGLLLKFGGIKVIYDVHEDLPQQVLAKDHILPPLRRLLSVMVRGLHAMAGIAFDRIIAATPTIANNFPSRRVTVIHNFPVLDEFPADARSPQESHQPYFVYVGGLSRIRGIGEMVDAVGRFAGRAHLTIAGDFSDEKFHRDVATRPGWNHVDYRGWQSRTSIGQILHGAAAGLVLLHPAPNYVDAMPIKLFEYMAAGIPVIASDFPLWRSIIDEAGAGICVDPLDGNAIVSAMQWIVDNPNQARTMGQRGRAAVVTSYNWHTEEKRLLEIYRGLGLSIRCSNNIDTS